MAKLPFNTANYIFKRKYGRYFMYAVVASFFVHIVMILGVPRFSGDVNVKEDSAMESIELPPEVVIPPPPQKLAKPSVPTEAPEELDEDITIEETTPPPPDLIPEMPVQQETQEAEEFLMVAEQMAKLKYMPPKPKMPSYIARARVEVTTLIEFFVDREGNVDPNRTKIVTSSGYPELDEIAVAWAKQMKFHPARNRGEPVPIRMAIPIKWSSK